MGEAVALARIEPALETRLIQIGRQRDSEPEMRLFVGGTPVAEIRNVDKPGPAKSATLKAAS